MSDNKQKDRLKKRKFLIFSLFGKITKQQKNSLKMKNLALTSPVT